MPGLMRLRQRLVEEGLNAVLISSPENRRYFSGFRGSAGYLLISQEAALLATDSRYTEQAKMESPGFQIVQTTSGPEDWFPKSVSALQVEKIGFEAQHLPYASYHQFVGLVKGAEKGASRIEFIPAGFLDSIRAVKEKEELQTIQRAIDISDAAFSNVAPTIDPGMTEKELAWKLERVMREMGSESMPFEIIVASGPNAAFPHHKPNDRPIGKGEPVIIDMGARVDGYSSDLSRTIYLGPPDNTFRRVYNTVMKAQTTAIETLKSGMTGETADGLARKVIEQAGYGEAFGHGLGHGVGLAIHEHPRLGRNSQHILEDGMVFTVEPGVYLPGWGGVRIEDVVVLVEGKAKQLSKAPKMRAEE